MPLLNYVEEFHQKTNPVEYPIMVSPLSETFLPLIDNVFDQREWKRFQYLLPWDSILVEALH